jgi:hypothetical protein
MSVFRLKGTAGAIINQNFPLEGKVLIGRADDCDIRIDEEEIAAHQAEIECKADGSVSIHVLKLNGSVRLNGEEVEQALLAGGDEIRIGSCRLMLQAPGLRPERVLTGEAIKPRTNYRPWLLAAMLGVTVVMAWQWGFLNRWITYFSGLIGG